MREIRWQPNGNNIMVVAVLNELPCMLSALTIKNEQTLGTS